MNTEAFKAAYGASRNGADHFIRHGMWRRLRYSDGVRDCAEAGCYWLLDIVGTELWQPFSAEGEGAMGILTVTVANGAADLKLEFQDDKPVWGRRVEFTDMPDGEWSFYIAHEGDLAMILPTEY